MELDDQSVALRRLRDDILRRVVHEIGALLPERSTEMPERQRLDHVSGFAEAREQMRNAILEMMEQAPAGPRLDLDKLIAAMPHMATELGRMMVDALPLFRQTGYNFQQITPSVSITFSTHDSDDDFVVRLSLEKSVPDD